MIERSVEQRLERLERDNRRLRVGIVGLCCLGALGLFGAQDAPTSTLQVEKLVVAGKDGAPQAVLGATPHGPRFTFFDGQQKKRIGISALTDGPVVSLYDAQGVPRMGMMVSPTGSSLALSDATNKVDLELGEDLDRGAYLEIKNDNARKPFKFP